MSTIRRNLVLKELEIKDFPNGKQHFFSIKFCKKDGEIVFIPRATSTGLPFNIKTNRMRGVVPVDDNGDKIGHVYPVNIDLILEYNKIKVKL